MIVWDRSGNTNCIFQLGKFSFLNILLICFLEYLLYIIWQIHTFMFIIYLSSILLQFPFLTSLMTLNHPLCLLPVFSFFTHWVQSVMTSRMLADPVGLGSSRSLSHSYRELNNQAMSREQHFTAFLPFLWLWHLLLTLFHGVPRVSV